MATSRAWPKTSASFCAQTYAGPTQLILGAQDPADPALTVAEQVRREHPGLDIVVVGDPTRTGPTARSAI